jgi:hypothetical protein
MKIFELAESIALSITCARKYNSCAFDGCFYYFTIQCSSEIIKTDSSFYITECFNTCREYDCISYDQTDHCFWAATKKHNNAVFKLNCNMCEIDCITIHGYDNYVGDITGISYNCYTNKLTIAFSNCVLETNKQTGDSVLLYQSNEFQITSVLSLCPGLVISVLYSNEQFVLILDSEGSVRDSQPISYELRIKSILFNPCVDNDDNFYLDFFVLKKGCYPYIYRYHLLLNQLPFQLCQCNFHICNECCCEEEHCGDPCASILNSIARVVAGIAKILDCEGKKLQKIIEESADVEVILNANKEVNKTICNVSQLEYLLYLKLNALVESGVCNEICEETEFTDETTPNADVIQ